MKIGIFGGSFDPIHAGHLYMAEKAVHEFELDRMIFVPAGHSPNKSEYVMTDFYSRYKMCKLAVQDRKNFEVSDIEIKVEDTSYTYLTLEKFKKIYKDDTLYFLLGADSLDYFEKWKNPHLIAKNAIILVVVRENFPIEKINKKIKELKKLFTADIRLLKCSQMDISSSMIRSSIKDNIDASKYLESDVIDYIKQNNLYR